MAQEANQKELKSLVQTEEKRIEQASDRDPIDGAGLIPLEDLEELQKGER